MSKLTEILDGYVGKYYEFYAQGRSNGWLDKQRNEAEQAINELITEARIDELKLLKAEYQNAISIYENRLRDYADDRIKELKR